MLASEIRARFLDYFRRQDHVVWPSSSLVPADDPTLLFVNAGMVQFKKVFLGMEDPPAGRRRATTAQKCVRAGGKHNDLEQVGHTARHHTFFEMLGNFSFGDYFKRDAIRFAWELITGKEWLGIEPSLLRVSVHYGDDEAFALWQEIAGLPASRIYRLGDKDNFWQMADTGPCGPCTEIYVDLAKVARDFRFPEGATGEWTDLNREEFSHDAFVEGGEAGRFLEIWNLVFMQFDRQADGTLVPLPKPSVDTGAGLERISAVKQGVTNNFHTDLFAPLLRKVEEIVKIDYRGRESDAKYVVAVPGSAYGLSVESITVDPASFRVLADHARAVAFLLTDGVFPSNEGRGYVLRRILRRAVRHAWLLGRREPTLVHVVQTLIETMGDAYPELHTRAEHLLKTTRVEEQAFLATIEGGLTRFEQLAPADAIDKGTISGEDAFRLYDTFGFPIDLTELMAHERGYSVDIAGFEAALAGQRTRSKEERKSRQLGVQADTLGELSGWERLEESAESRFVGYDTVEIRTDVAAIRRIEGDRVAMLLRESPFYAESGGQIADVGEIIGDGWRLDVDGVRKVDGRSAVLGTLAGEFHWGMVTARVPTMRRKDTERNHTATHLLHASLRQVLGESVHQAGSLVAPDRLRFDFTHHGPVDPEKLKVVETLVNQRIFDALPVTWNEMPYPEARAKGAMALFGEKYGDVVRVVNVPGFSMELCGGTHVRNTSEIGLFVLLHESGVASGVRRIEALTGPAALAHLSARASALGRVASLLRAPVDGVEHRLAQLLEERRALEKQLGEATRGGGDALQQLLAAAQPVGHNGAKLVVGEVTASDAKALQALGDAVREQLRSGVAVLGMRSEDGKGSLLAVVTDDLREKGLRADAIVRDVAAVAGGRGGGKPHMAQAGVPDASRLGAALAEAPRLVAALMERA